MHLPKFYHSQGVLVINYARMDVSEEILKL